jgi:hypothetical protein
MRVKLAGFYIAAALCGPQVGEFVRDQAVHGSGPWLRVLTMNFVRPGEKKLLAGNPAV